MIGECIAINHDKKSISIRFPVYDQECTHDFKYLKRYCTLSMPKGAQNKTSFGCFMKIFVGGQEITQELFNECEGENTSERVLDDLQISPGDILFVKAEAWKSSFYKHQWPYSMINISSAYFQATVEKFTKNGKVQLSFHAFEMESRKNEYSRYVNS